MAEMSLPTTAATKKIEAELDALGAPETASFDPLAMLPETRVIKIGGQSIMDRGRRAVFPILEEIVAAKERHSILIGAGGGTRARHAYDIALDLGLPTGVLASVGGFVPRQNARMLQMLLAKRGGIFILHDDFEKLPLYFRLGCIPIMTGMPPFEYWEKPAVEGRIPMHRTDAGVFLSAEALGCQRVWFVKDEEGLYTADPKKDPKAEHIPRIEAGDLLEMNLDDLVIERVCVEYLTRTRFVREIQIVNGLKPGNLTHALDGDDVGTIIYRGN